jgi:hypothetical protein
VEKHFEQDVTLSSYGDSSAVIACIKREQLGVFVWNWVQEISVTSKQAWQNAPFAINPADLPSHGCSDNCYSTGGGWDLHS